MSLRRIGPFAAVALAALAALGGAGCRAVCGDGRLTGDEACDTILSPGCLDDCTGFATCGNGIVEANEDCDDGPNNSDDTPDACREDCRAPRCGDGVQDTGEPCDGDACTCDFDCVIIAVCGDGMLGPCEECDDGPCPDADMDMIPDCDLVPDSCRSDCRMARCGDDVVDSVGEECDDGLTDIDGDGLTNSDALPDRCRSTCLNPFCGDNVTDTGEECDGQATCSPMCTASFCGDGILDVGEDCDDGPNNSDLTPDACRTSCVLPSCGDGTPDPSLEIGMMMPPLFEQCDDDNFVVGDGCSALCQWENSCFTNAAMSPNGTLEPGEDCDMGMANMICDGMCQFVAGTACAAAVDLDDPTTGVVIMGPSHTYMGDSGGAANDSTPMMCLAGAGEDVIHRIYLLQDSRVDVTVSAAFADVVYALRDCVDTATEAACDDDTGMDPVINFNGNAGDDWFIIVDGVGAADAGPYTIVVTVRPLRQMGEECDVMGVLNFCAMGSCSATGGPGGGGECM